MASFFHTEVLKKFPPDSDVSRSCRYCKQHFTCAKDNIDYMVEHLKENHLKTYNKLRRAMKNVVEDSESDESSGSITEERIVSHSVPDSEVIFHVQQWSNGELYEKDQRMEDLMTPKGQKLLTAYMGMMQHSSKFEDSFQSKNLKKNKGKGPGTKKMSKKTYVIERVLGHKRIDGRLHYLIRWEGYGSSADTYEPIESFSSVALIAIHNYVDNALKNGTLIEPPTHSSGSSSPTSPIEGDKVIAVALENIRIARKMIDGTKEMNVEEVQKSLRSAKRSLKTLQKIPMVGQSPIDKPRAFARRSVPKKPAPPKKGKDLSALYQDIRRMKNTNSRSHSSCLINADGDHGSPPKPPELDKSPLLQPEKSAQNEANNTERSFCFDESFFASADFQNLEAVVRDESVNISTCVEGAETEVDESSAIRLLKEVWRDTGDDSVVPSNKESMEQLGFDVESW
ncbi:unnamed protein product [Bursaphelenchus xylophilus]|uniref:(pine wood nematode) hypothetical protein n=1 Tax=Bursaphelenchus xylophilus TaxID=6326 RepID=A0A811M090_BURXY|nr:unnamed protein product [Bursaphelenchus xylophilus]CAG9128300.1 unnamed protein product [Bursaphelenchus xylophilus]